MTNTILSLLFTAATNTFNLPPGLINSVCYVETTHNVHAINENDGGSPSIGICQVKLKTAKWLGFDGTEKELMRPSVNIFYAAKYLAKQHKRYGGDSAKAVIAYNMGSAKMLTSTSYSDKVFKHWEAVNYAKDN